MPKFVLSGKRDLELWDLATKEDMCPCQVNKVLPQNIQVCKVAVWRGSCHEDRAPVDFERQTHARGAGPVLRVADDDHVFDPQDTQSLVGHECLGGCSEVQEVDVNWRAGARKSDDGLSELDIERDDGPEGCAPDNALNERGRSDVGRLVEIGFAEEAGEGVVEVGWEDVFEVGANRHEDLGVGRVGVVQGV